MITSIAVIRIQAQVFGTSNYPAIGKQCPFFKFTHVLYSEKKEISLNDVRSQYLVLYFWSSSCSSCIKSFQKLNELNSKFKGKVEFLLIGIYDNRVQKIFERFREKFGLNLPAVFDSTVYKQFGVTGVPHVIWINKKMIVKAITAESDDINEDNVAKFSNNSEFNYTDYSVKAEAEKENAYDYTKPLLINENGGSDTDFLFRSILTKAKLNTYQEIPPFIGVGQTGDIPEINDHWMLIRPNMVQCRFMSVSMLYDLVYGDTIPHNPVVFQGNAKALTTSYGRYWIKPILEVRDSTEFETDEKTAKNFYDYSLVVPPGKATTPYVRAIMQRDLKNYFGFSAEIEDRLMPCWILTCSNEARENCTANGGVTFYDRDASYIEIKNGTIKCLIHSLWNMNQDKPPFIDETGIIKNINLKIDADITDFEELRNALQKKGFYLTKAERRMKVIVIKD